MGSLPLRSSRGSRGGVMALDKKISRRQLLGAGGAAPNPVVGGAVTPESAAAYLAYGRTLRGFLDDNGLEAIGNHGFIPNTWPGPSSAGGAISTLDRDRWTVELEFASVLGMPFMGTGGDPTGSSQIEQWDIA